MITQIIIDSKNTQDVAAQKSAEQFKRGWIRERQATLEFMRETFNDLSISPEKIKYTQMYSIFKYTNDYGIAFDDIVITHGSIFTYVRDGYVFSKNKNVLELQSLSSFEVTTKHHKRYSPSMFDTKRSHALSLPLENGLQDLQRVFSTGEQVLDYPRDLYWYGETE